MKAKIILFFFLLLAGIVSAQVKRVAILETVDKENQIDYAYELLLRGNLSDAITSISGYEAYDRTDIDAIMSEQSFQRTGLVSSDQIKRLGEMTGASYILVAEMAKSGQQIIILSKLLDVETARTIMSDHEITTLNEIQDACKRLAKRMFHEEVKEEPKVETNFELIRHTASEQKLLGVKKYSYGGNQMDEKAFREFLYKNNSRAYADYMKGRKLIGAGWGTFSAGLVSLLAIGTGLFVGGLDAYYVYSDYGYGWYEPDYSLVYTGIAFMSIGGILTATSIPILGVGYAKKKRAYDLRNYSYTANNSMPTQPTVSLSLQSSQNGIGLALNF